MDRLPVGMAAGHLVLGALADMDLLPVEDLGGSPMEAAMVEATEATSNARVLGSKIGIRSGLGTDRNGRPSTGKTEVVFRIKVTFDEWYSMMIDGETCCAVFLFFFFLLSFRSQIISFTHDSLAFPTWRFGILYFSLPCLC